MQLISDLQEICGEISLNLQAFLLRNILYISLILLATSCSNYQKIVKDGTPQEKLDAARKYYKAKDYLRAQPLLEELLGLYYGRVEREEIYYLYAYSYFGNHEYLLAGYHFNNFAETYSLSDKKEEAEYMTAVCKFKKTMPQELDQTPTKDAIKNLQSYINEYPNSSYVADCNDKIDILRERILLKVYQNAKLYYDLGYYKSAMVACQNAIDDYPDINNRTELSYLVADAAYLYAKNSVQKKKPERFREALQKAEEFEKEFGKTNTFSASLSKIKEKTKAELAQINIE
ncbi:MAG: outer membrane protein assembly factor BamD [Bacteroidia bacterium]|nr:outer membrane protein assembly factor BamD [Bacteroidia bacterium]